MKNIGDFLGLRRNILVMLAGVFALGLGEGFWSRFMPKYLESLGQIADSAQKLVFLPYEASGIMASLGGIKELLQAK